MAVEGRLYKYVGSAEVIASVANAPPGVQIKDTDDLQNWLAANWVDVEQSGLLVATFVVDQDGTLLLAPRRTEHVACASGGPVRSAGEIAFTRGGRVAEVSNLSTGYCPEPESWPTVAAALKYAVPNLPHGFSRAFTFRRCLVCGQVLLIKEGWFVCDVCDADVPTHWNFEDK